jgi:polyisoprenyl-phosphate glycosyltransferase
MAADLQDPPDTIPALLDKWRQGAKIVWAVRDRTARAKPRPPRGARKIYYWLMRRFVGVADMPSAGADFFLVDRQVMDVLQAFKETNVSLLALLTWMGFRQDRIFLCQAGPPATGRRAGASSKKLKLLVDSITAFTYKPIRWMSYVGFGVALLGFGYALVVVVNRVFFYTPVQGYASLIVAILLIGGLQMMMMGVLGEYIWRALDEARNRPRFIVEDEVGFEAKGNSTSIFQ